jgi:hypothetical protein
LLADDLESLIQYFAGVLIRSGSDGQFDHTLLFGFEIDRHGCSLFNVIFLPADRSNPNPQRPAVESLVQGNTFI